MKPLIVSLSLLMLLCVLPAGAESDSAKLKKLCKQALKGTVKERASAVLRLGENLGEKEVIRTLRKVLKDEKHTEVLIVALETTAKPAAASLYKDVLHLAFHSYLDIRRQATIALAAQDREKAVEDFLKKAKKGGPEGVESIRALTRFIRNSETKSIVHFLKHRDAAIRTVAIASLMKIGAIDQAEIIAKKLSDKSEMVVRQAALAMGFFRARFAVSALIELTAKPEVRTEALHSLWILTSRDFGGKVKVWREWFREFGVTIQPSPFERLGGSAYITFFKHRVKAGRFIFLLDYSDSMGSGSGSSLEAQTNEVIRSVRILPPNVEFNCVIYSRSAVIFKPDAVEADAVSKADFFTWLGRNGTDAYTATYDGFKLALAVNNVEIIFLSGNGLPNHGDLPAGDNKETEDNVVTAIIDKIKEKGSKTKVYAAAFPFAMDLFEDKQDMLVPKEQQKTNKSFEKRAEGFFRLIVALSGGEYCFVPIAQHMKGKKGR